MQRLALVADCFLDTVRYSGGATTTDAMAAGLKVVTLDGRAGLDDRRLFSSPVGRLSQSLVHQTHEGAHARNMVVTSLKDYEDVVVRLAIARWHPPRSDPSTLLMAAGGWAQTFTHLVFSMAELAVAESSGWRTSANGTREQRFGSPGAHLFFPTQSTYPEPEQYVVNSS